MTARYVQGLFDPHGIASKCTTHQDFRHITMKIKYFGSQPEELQIRAVIFAQFNGHLEYPSTHAMYIDSTAQIIVGSLT